MKTVGWANAVSKRAGAALPSGRVSAVVRVKPRLRPSVGARPRTARKTVVARADVKAQSLREPRRKPADAALASPETAPKPASF